MVTSALWIALVLFVPADDSSGQSAVRDAMAQRAYPWYDRQEDAPRLVSPRGQSGGQSPRSWTTESAVVIDPECNRVGPPTFNREER